MRKELEVWKTENRTNASKLKLEDKSVSIS